MGKVYVMGRLCYALDCKAVLGLSLNTAFLRFQHKGLVGEIPPQVVELESILKRRESNMRRSISVVSF